MSTLGTKYWAQYKKALTYSFHQYETEFNVNMTVYIHGPYLAGFLQLSYRRRLSKCFGRRATSSLRHCGEHTMNELI